MKRTILFAALAAATLCAETITQADRDFAVKNLEASRKAFVDSLEGVSEAQWKFKASPERWSIAETAEHIAASEELIMKMVTDKVLKAEPMKAEQPVTRADDEAVIVMVRDRSKKAQAPEMLKPTNRWASKEALIADFNKFRDQTIQFAQTTQDDLRAHATPHPVRKRMDAYQWLLLNSAHSERHTAQIEEVKADPGYPKK